MQQSQNINYIQEDEIDLKELFKYKKFILIFTFSITVLSIIFVYVKTPIYEVKSNIQIGYRGGKLVDEPNNIVKISRLNFHIDDKIPSKKSFVSEVTDISLNKKIKNFVEIKTEAISNEEALKKNKEVVSFIQNMYDNKINEYKRQNNNKIKSLQIQIDKIENKESSDIKREIKKLKEQKIVQIDEKIDFLKTNKIKTLKEKITIYTDKLNKYQKSVQNIYKNNQKNIDKTTSTLASLQIVNYQNLILNAQNKIEDLKLQITLIKDEQIPSLQREKENLKNITIKDLEYKLNTLLPIKKQNLLKQIDGIKYLNSKDNVQNSKVIGGYIIKDYPAKPKKKLIVILAFVAALILSIFLVFLIEFFRENEKDSIANKT